MGGSVAGDQRTRCGGSGRIQRHHHPERSVSPSAFSEAQTTESGEEEVAHAMVGESREAWCRVEGSSRGGREGSHDQQPGPGTEKGSRISGSIRWHVTQRAHGGRTASDTGCGERMEATATGSSRVHHCGSERRFSSRQGGRGGNVVVSFLWTDKHGTLPFSGRTVRVQGDPRGIPTLGGTHHGGLPCGVTLLRRLTQRRRPFRGSTEALRRGETLI